MSQKNDTVPLLLAFLITAGLVGAGLWWLTQRSGLNLGNGTPTPTPSDSVAPGDSTAPSAPTSPTTANSGATNFNAVQAVPTGLFTYGGSTTWAPIRGIVDPAITAARPEFRLRYVNPISGAPGSSTGIQMLLRDQLAFSQSSRALLEQELQQATQRGIRLKQVPVAIDGIAVAVNPDLPISGITIRQLQDIYLGRVKNWREVGGPNLPIVPISRPIEAGGTVEFFVSEVLGNQPFGNTVVLIGTTTEALRAVTSTPGAVYFASAPEVVPQCKVKSIALGQAANQLVTPYQEPLVPASNCPQRRNRLNTAAFQGGQYPLTRSLYVIVKQNGQVEEQAGDAYAQFLLTNEGQQLIEKSGFVRIR